VVPDEVPVIRTVFSELAGMAAILLLVAASLAVALPRWPGG